MSNTLWSLGQNISLNQYVWLRRLFLLLTSFSLFSYLRGYSLFFEHFILFKNKSFLIEDGQIFKILVVTNIIVFILNSFLRKNAILSFIGLLLFSFIHLNLSNYLNEYTTNTTFWALLIICIADIENGAEKIYRKVPFLFTIILGLAYSSSGLSKMLTEGWASGELLLEHLKYNHFLFERDNISPFLIRYSHLASILIIVFELLFIFTLTSKKKFLVASLAGLLFHGLVLKIFGINFFYFFASLYLGNLFLLVPRGAFKEVLNNKAG